MKNFLMVMSVIVLFAACSKNPTVAPNRENQLRAKKWKLSGGTITIRKPNGRDTTLQYLNFIPACYKDDYITFDSNRHGTRYVGATTCDIAGPANRYFVWELSNNDNTIDLYDGFNDIFAINDMIQPYHFETLSTAPLVLDTILGRLDTIPGFIKQFIVLDTIRELRMDSVALEPFDIYKADITDFTESSFTLHFSFKYWYPDSTNFHAGAPNNYAPIMRPDTLHYAFKYTAF